MNTIDNISIPSRPPFKRVGLIIHVVAWAILFGLPFFVTGKEQQELTVVNYIHNSSFVIYGCFLCKLLFAGEMLSVYPADVEIFYK